jgi:hypothetical protein
VTVAGSSCPQIGNITAMMPVYSSQNPARVYGAKNSHTAFFDNVFRMLPDRDDSLFISAWPFWQVCKPFL